MKLYLSSYRIPEKKSLFELFDKRAERLVGGIIVNAKDQNSPEDKSQKLDQLKDDLARIGLAKTVFVDLNNYDDPRELGEDLSDYDYLYAAGGNSFVLRQSMRRSGFDSAAKHLLDAGQVYVGESAGAIVAGPSLHGFDLVDDIADETTVRWNGLGLIDTIIVPHNDSPDLRYANRAPGIAIANPNFVVQPLNDNQALVVVDSNLQIIDGLLHV